MSEAAKKKIVIVDDEKPMAHALQLKLQHEGFDAFAEFDGEAGLALIEKESPDMILLDLIMPKLDGFSVLEKNRAKGIKTPIVVLSNLSQEDDEKKARALGANGFFIKSNIPIADIVNTVKQTLG